MSLSQKFITPSIWTFMDLWELNWHLLTYLMCYQCIFTQMEGIVCRHCVDCLSRLLFFDSSVEISLCKALCSIRGVEKGKFCLFSQSFHLYLMSGVDHTVLHPRTFIPRHGHWWCFDNVQIWLSLWKLQVFTVKHISSLMGSLQHESNKPCYLKV